MNAFLAVSSKDWWKRKQSACIRYWCILPQYQASLGDLLFLYKAGTGIVQLYTLTTRPYISEYFKCVMRKMLTVDTKLIATFQNPLTALEMQSNPALKTSEAIGGNFQQTTFALSEIESIEIINHLAVKNPTQSDVIKSFYVS